MVGNPDIPQEVLHVIMANIPYEGPKKPPLYLCKVDRMFCDVFDDVTFPLSILRYRFPIWADIYDHELRIQVIVDSRRRAFTLKILSAIWEQQVPLQTWKWRLRESGLSPSICEIGVLMAECITVNSLELTSPFEDGEEENECRVDQHETQVLFLANLIQQLPREALLLWVQILRSAKSFYDSKYDSLLRLVLSGPNDTVLVKYFALECARDVSDMDMPVLLSIPEEDSHRLFDDYYEKLGVLAASLPKDFISGPALHCDEYLLFPMLFLALMNVRTEGQCLVLPLELQTLVMPTARDSKEDKIRKLGKAFLHRLEINQQLEHLFKDETRASAIANLVDLREVGRTTRSVKERVKGLTSDQIRAEIRRELERWGTNQWFPPREDAEMSDSDAD